ncbi:ABC transporter substrate-binding protein [Mesorhizobium muleiense]|nr:ABC transporter substrate-binding protein [Mesorhizobium muleiense]
MNSFLKSCTALTVALAFSGQAIAQVKELGKGEGQVNIVAWPGYIERGETDKNYDWVTSFEKNTGCKVNLKTANTSDEMVALMNEGGFDLVTASGDASLRLVAGKRVQPINTDLIPSWSTVDDRLKDAPWFTVGGAHYGAPYQWGPNVLMYNTEVFKEAPKSWNVVFEEMTLPDGKSNKGRVQAYDGPIHIADAANYLMSHKPELGIKDPYELTEDQYKAALDLLRVQRTLVGRYWHDAAIQVDDFQNEGVVASGSWPYQVNTLVAAKKPVASTIPRKASPAGPTRPCWQPTQPTRTAPICGWSTRCHRKCRAMSPPGSVRCRWCRLPARATNCSATKAARPTATTISKRSNSGRRRCRNAPPRTSACLTIAGCRTISASSADGEFVSHCSQVGAAPYPP